MEFLQQWGPLVIGVLVLAAAFAVLIVGTLFAVRKFYVVPKSDEALVKTGGKEPKVSVGGGMWVIPLFHQVARVSLQAVRIKIDRTAADAVPTKDMIQAEIRGEMFVQIDPNISAAILLAVQSLGVIDPDDMSEVVQEKIDSQITDALRTAAFQKTFIELNSQKKEFAEEIRNSLTEDLQKLGLSLRSVAVTHVSQGQFSNDANDVISAQGRRNVAETVERSRQETNRLTKAADVEVLKQNVEAREQSLNLERQQKEKEADQDRKVAEYVEEQSTQKKKAILSQEQAREEAVADKDKAVKQAQITADQSVATAKIEAEKTIALKNAQAAAERANALASQKVAEEQAAQREETAMIEREKALELASTEKVRALKVAEEQQGQAIEEAAVQRQVAVAQKKSDEANAKASQALAEAKQKEAEEAVITVRAKADADRTKQIGLIKSSEIAEKDKIEADKKAYVEVKQAEGERDAVAKRSEAVVLQAESDAKAKTAAAEGEAQAMKARAQGYAADIQLRAEADAKAADQQAEAKIKLADALLAEGKAKAESKRLEVEAGNAIARELLIRDVTIEALSILPALAHEVMAPMGKMAEGTKILQIQGLNGGTGDAVDSLPGTVMKAGVMSLGLWPALRDFWQVAKDVPEVQDALRKVAETGKGAAREVLNGSTPQA